MKRSIVREFVKGGNQVRLLSHGKNLFVLNPVVEQQQVEGFHFEKNNLLKQETFENNLRFDINLKRDALLVMDDQSKSLKSYSLTSVIS